MLYYEATGKCLVILVAAVAGETGFSEAFGSLLLEFQIAAEDFVPGQTLLVEFLHKGIGIELFDIPYARTLPEAEHKHAGTDAGGHTRRVADALHTRFFVGSAVRAVVVDVVGLLFAVLQSTDAATDAGLAIIVLAEVLRVGQHGLEELEGNYLHLDGTAAIGGFGGVFKFVDARHSDVLDNVEVLEVLLAEGHPEAGALDGGLVLHKALNLLVVEEVAFLRTDIGIGQGLVNL